MKYGGNYYVTSTGTQINPKEDPRAKAIIDNDQNYVNDSLTYSDQVQTGDLLRFHKLAGYKQDDPKNYSYKKNDTLKSLKDLEKKSQPQQCKNRW
ncbi:Lipoteichoic acid synthase 2 [Weissella viridescens]|uniref:Lipoteichoic acid synthase 2 n=1 Tax=Weissella viridescens TaxID=1629 RepID=A0A380NX96_WEIVI|nr:Lipoteichoic acid synthase 2 [Weissella viridescens]